MPLRRQLLNEAMAGVGFERETVRATELVTAQGDRKYVRVVADDRKLGRLLRRAVPVVDGCAGEHTVVVDDESDRDVRQ
jgi:hypothetical protein